ncbi:hypothetical protein L1987_16575 [Smallanthus sonchifolius]|uniref:Uncharacterized protein n=1 Tax=Smallanthus sonchifolius TaxID=185202 RepID=A0ACB9IVD5_9ASTR|nr:hypothetical protein L1987_16575 [Smallanthus sonchifolius]
MCCWSLPCSREAHFGISGYDSKPFLTQIHYDRTLRRFSADAMIVFNLREGCWRFREGLISAVGLEQS